VTVNGGFGGAGPPTLALWSRLTDPEPSPLDLTLDLTEHIVVASEYPIGAPGAVARLREFEPTSDDLVHVLGSNRPVEFRGPRGLTFGADARLYCVGEDHVVVFDFSTGEFLRRVVQHPRRHGQPLAKLCARR